MYDSTNSHPRDAIVAFLDCINPSIKIIQSINKPVNQSLHKKQEIRICSRLRISRLTFGSFYTNNIRIPATPEFRFFIFKSQPAFLIPRFRMYRFFIARFIIRCPEVVLYCIARLLYFVYFVYMYRDYIWYTIGIYIIYICICRCPLPSRWMKPVSTRN